MKQRNARRPLSRRAQRTQPRHHYTKNKRLDFAAINHAARASLPTVLDRYLAGGRYEGCEYVALNPTRADEHLGSFRVNVKTGRWADFATDDKGGDLVSLVAFVTQRSQAEAARELARFLGLGGGL